MVAAEQKALVEDLAGALGQVQGDHGVRVLRWALQELPLDGGTAVAIADRLIALEALRAA